MAVCQNLVPLVNIKIAGKWMFIPLKMVSIGIDPYPYLPIIKKFSSTSIQNSLSESGATNLVREVLFSAKGYQG
jgi:hypothetical protein